MTQFVGQNVQLHLLHSPFTNQSCLALCTVECTLLLVQGARANPHFFICFSVHNILSFRAAVIVHVLYVFIRNLSETLEFFCPFCRLLNLDISRKNIVNHTVIQTATVPHFFEQKCCTQKGPFVGLYFFRGRKE